MNVYLDIDGVLLVNELHHANFAPEFLEYVLTMYPETTYWLTTHCQGDANTPIWHIGHMFDTKSLGHMSKIKPTKWDISKTQAIDFTQPFLWFDDDLFDAERTALIEHNALDNWIQVDLAKNPNMLQQFITSFPLPHGAIDTV